MLVVGESIRAGVAQVLALGAGVMCVRTEDTPERTAVQVPRIYSEV